MEIGRPVTRVLCAYLPERNVETSPAQEAGEEGPAPSLHLTLLPALLYIPDIPHILAIPPPFKRLAQAGCPEAPEVHREANRGVSRRLSGVSWEV